jgi:RNA polymerase sigma-70 factor (ECF subfamily)
MPGRGELTIRGARDSSRYAAAAQTHEERSVLEAAREGDARAFEVLAASHMARHLAYARFLTRNHADAEDLVQRAYEIAWKKMPSQPVARFGPWVQRILFNLAQNLWRARRSDRTVSMTGGDGAVLDLPDERRSLADVEDSLYLRGILSGLEPSQRDSLHLRFVEDLTYREMGERFGVTKQSAEERTKKAIAAARAVVNERADVDR